MANREPARVGVVALDGGESRMLTAPDRISVNMPGACAGARITYSSDEFDDEIYTAERDGSSVRRLTDRGSPDGGTIAFESPADPDLGTAFWRLAAP